MAIEVTAQDVKAFATELADESDSRVDLMLEYSDNFINENKWGRKFKMAKILMTAHLLIMGQRNGASGAVASESLGDHSISYSTPDADDFMKLTSYGQQYLALRKTLTITPFVL